MEQNQIDRLFADIGLRTQYLSDNRDNAGCLLLARAIDFALLQDFTNAESDLNLAVQADPDNWAVWFCRAQIRARSVEVRKAEQDNDNQTDNTGHGVSAEAGYRMVIRDLSQAIDLEPSFAFAYYNRGTFHAMTNDMHAALVDFDKAIELDETLARHGTTAVWYL